MDGQTDKVIYKAKIWDEHFESQSSFATENFIFFWTRD